MLQDLRYAIRALKSTPAFAAVAILSLALGIGANTAIFSLINSLILKTLPVNHPEQLLQITRGKDDHYTNPIWEQLRDHQDVFSGIFAIGGDRINLAPGGEARYADLSYVSGQFFETLGLHTVLGRTLTTADDKRGCPGTAVLGHAFWQKEYGGRADVVGKTISLDNHPFEIVGVLQPGFTGIDVGTSNDLYVPVCSEKIIRGSNSVLDGRTWWWMKIIGRPSVSPAQATARLTTLAPEVFKATLPPNMKPEAQSEYLNNTFDTLPVASGISELRTQYQRALTILMVITGLVLLIACANVANLLLARSAARQREIAIRIALGLRRGRLMRQLLTESLVLSLTGAALGIFFAQWGARLLIRFLSSANDRVYLDLTIDFRVLAFTAGVAILTGLLFGLTPAWRGTRVDPQSAMKANARGVISSEKPGSRFGIGKALVVAQVALSLLLVVGAGLMLSTFFKLETVDTGFNRDHVLLASVDLSKSPKERMSAVLQEMLDRLRALPGVRSASASSMTPISGWRWSGDVRIEGYTPKSKEDSNLWFNSVTSGFFETVGTGILAGRDFNAHDAPHSPPVAIVNETLAKKFFAGQNPIGKRYRADESNKLGEPVEIVGVVKDAKYRSLREEVPPTAYLPSTQGAFFQQHATFEIRTAAAPAALVSAAKSAIAEVDRDVSIRFTTLATQVDESLIRERLLATLSGFFGALALLLATIGLYGVMSYNVARRRNEIGIRMALGAEQSRVRTMVLKEVAILIGIGLTIGLAAALATTRFIASFLYGIKSTDPVTLFAAAAVLAIVAAIAGYCPARQASRLDPMAALREE